MDFIPSRGARHETGKGDSWATIDKAVAIINELLANQDIPPGVRDEAQVLLEKIEKHK